MAHEEPFSSVFLRGFVAPRAHDMDAQEATEVVPCDGSVEGVPCKVEEPSCRPATHPSETTRDESIKMRWWLFVVKAH